MSYAVGIPSTTPNQTTVDVKRDVFTVAVDGETNFTLSSVPLDQDSVELDVNGIEGDFTLAGAVATWTGPYQLKNGYELTFRYI